MKDRFQVIALILALVALLSPFFILAFYTVPAADDYYFSTQAKQLDFLQYLYHFYMRYTGRMLPTGLFYFNPVSFDAINLYFIIPLVSLIVLFLALYSIVPVFWPQKGTRTKHLIIALAGFVILLHRWPSTAEGFYWVSGILFYTLPISLFLLFLRIINDLACSGVKQGWKYLFGRILAFALPLSNEVVIVPMAGLIVLMYFWRFTRESLSRKLHIITLLFCVGLLISVFAPGNEARMGDFRIEHNLMEAAFISLTHIGKLVGYQFQNPALLIAIIGLIPIAKRMFSSPGIFKKLEGTHPMYIILGSTAVLWAMYFPSQYLTGYVPWRIHNTADIVLFIAIFIFTARISLRFDLQQLPKWLVNTMIIVSLLLMVSDFQWKGRSEAISFRGNIPLAWSDLLTKAKPYKIQWHERIEEAESSPAMDLNFSAFNDVPESIHFVGLKNDPQNDLNRWFADYYELSSVQVEPNSKE